MKGFAYLVMISPDSNNNRFYRMTQEKDIFIIEMGRVGATPVTLKRPMSLWDVTYNKKIAEGYMDRSNCCEVNVQGEGKYAPIPEASVKSLIDDLMRYANTALSYNYTISWKEVTPTMIHMAQDIIHSMPINDIETFNQKLISLFTVIPRKMKNVVEMMAHEMDDIPVILEREQDLLDVLSAKISQEKKMAESRREHTVLDALGLSVRECTWKESEQIKKHMSDESAHLFLRAFRVNNHKTDERFYTYMKNHGMTERDIHYYYHGSKNRNYLGIMTEGLLLNPKAPITGKMFGHGIYFASRAKKSINYTDISGSYWNNGTMDQAYLMVYKVAYKNPKDIYVWSNEMTTYRKDVISPHDAVFAHKGVSLVNDEIIVYDEAQATLQYIVELAV